VSWRRRGSPFETALDTELMAGSRAHARRGLGGGAPPRLRPRRRRLLLRDRHANSVIACATLRLPPLCIGFIPLGGQPAHVVASETCASTRSTRPSSGRFSRADGDHGRARLTVVQFQESGRHAMCVFEFIYLPGPTRSSRMRAGGGPGPHGRELAREQPVEAACHPLPDSGTPAPSATPRSPASPSARGLIKSRSSTHVHPSRPVAAGGRRRAQAEPLRRSCAASGSSRSTTRSSGAHLAPDHRRPPPAGAREVHIRVSSPPMRFPVLHGRGHRSTKQLSRPPDRRRGAPAHRRRLARLSLDRGADATVGRAGSTSLPGLLRRRSRYLSPELRWTRWRSRTR